MTGADKIYLFTQGLALAALLTVLLAGLLPALLGGLLVYHLVEFGARILGRAGIIPATGRLILLTLVVLIFILAFAYSIIGFASYITDGPESLSVLLRKMADVVDAGRSYLPLWVQQYLPANFEEWQVSASDWLRENARNFTVIGQEAGVFLAHLVFGMIIGGMVAISPGFQEIRSPFAQALSERIGFVGGAFHRIVFSQVQISAVNTFLTALFLVLVMPALGSPLPLTKTMIAVTFMAGLLPIVGNLISNTVIFLIALSVSPLAAVGSLTFLVVLHKLEYFLNAHIIGTQIRARAWEILLSMLVMESVFGLAGIVAAPIYYAYLKDELRGQKLI